MTMYGSIVFNVTIPKHPQASRGEYLNYSPYTELYMNISPFGTIVIDTLCCKKQHYTGCYVC